MEISDWRSKIDELDEDRLWRSSANAPRAAKAISELKRQIATAGATSRDGEMAVFDHVRAVNPGPLADAEMQHVYERIIDVMRTLQRRDA